MYNKPNRKRQYKKPTQISRRNGKKKKIQKKKKNP